ncbi:MAG: competence type IV pilus major pilin ComGC [Coriobacteriales bacterium]|jgi:type IV pilus assembly protein PilA
MQEIAEGKRAQLGKRSRKGFTLMEMLIVVAIIAVLVAIAIPIFTTQLNNARVEADAANIRSGYATVSATVLTDGTTSDTTYYLKSDGTVSTSSSDATFNCQGDAKETQNVAGQDLTWSSGSTVSYEYNSTDQKVEIKITASSN